ncbi:MAG TPA: ABC transporter substrate-binding protein [Stellaceae bacterium]|jgi:NitT/TauT family transport system substrate-binding protein|nr:ABC transporter substrate-binding protein [Stellaceae bacterium]
MPRRWGWRRLGGAGVAALLAALLISTSAVAAEKASIAVLKLASSGAIFIAQSKGYFAAEGLDTQLKFLDAAQPVALAVVSGDADIGATGLTAGFYNLAGKGALRIFGGQSREEPGYHLIAYLVSNKAYDAGLKKLGDLAGHSVAITQVGSTFHYSLGLLAEKLHFDLASVHLVPLQSMSNMAAALKGGQVDAALIPGTIAAPMVDRGEAHLLGWVGDETPWQLGALFASVRTVEERKPMLQAFLRAYRKGARELYDAFLKKGPDGKPQEGPGAAALLPILAEYTGQSVDQLKSAIPYVDPDAALLVDDIHHQVSWYQEHSLVNKNVEAGPIVAAGFVEGQIAPTGAR